MTQTYALSQVPTRVPSQAPSPVGLVDKFCGGKWDIVGKSG